MAALTNYTIDQIADYLTDGFWDYQSFYSFSFNMGSLGNGPNNGVLHYNYFGFSGISGAGTDADGLSAERRALVDHALDYLGEILGIKFVPTTSIGSEVDLFFKDSEAGAFSNAEVLISGNNSPNHRYVNHAWVNIEPGWYGGDSSLNGFTYQTVIHEILHALGLGHSGPYNNDGSVGYEPVYVTDSLDAIADRSNIYLNDSLQQTIMTYFDQEMNTSVDASLVDIITPMAADMEALRSLYGSSAFTGDTVYGFNTNISSTISEAMARLSEFADARAFCIIDDGGYDTLDFSGFSADQRIDLTVATGSSTTGTISNIGGLTGNMTLAVGTVIEKALGGSGNDVITGNGEANSLFGNAGNDRIAGAGGQDVIDGGAGIDAVVYSGVRADYTQDLQVDGTILVTKADGIDLLFNIERLDMTDGDYVFDIDSDNLGICYRLYGAGFGRSPDEGGLRYWTGVMDDLDVSSPGLDKLDFLANQFLAAQEFTLLYGANPSDEDYVDAMYQNVLKRQPDQGGYDYWVGQMQAGLGRDDILVFFSESLENRLNADVDYDDGVWVL